MYKLAACRRETSEVSNSSFANEVTLIIRSICQGNHLQKLPKSKKSGLSDNLLDNELFYEMIMNEGLYSNRKTLEFHLNTLFKGINFRNKRVLDIGGGKGIHSFYAAWRGAKEVICLEPEADGSSSGVIEKFQRLSRSLRLNNISLEQEKIQSCDPKGRKFDLTLMHNVINHLDEIACMRLLEDKAAKASYREVFLKISALSANGATLIICDCSRYNFFALFKLPNPFVPSIEWHKHQAPEVWIELLNEAGYINSQIRWSSFNKLSKLGRVTLGNKIASYFFMSHFCLMMQKS
jgi:SAM-dependent methyltransferase